MDVMIYIYDKTLASALHSYFISMSLSPFELLSIDVENFQFYHFFKNVCLLCCEKYVFICSLSKLKQLTTLKVGDQNFFQGLPEVIGELTSLETLHLNDCELLGLPQRYHHKMAMMKQTFLE